MLIDTICANLTKNTIVTSGEKVRSLESIRQLNADLAQMAATTYTSSAIFKVLTANLLAFGPIIVEQLIRLVLQ
ncbi:MAG: hypothetical protein QW279_00195 [Candidatus Jordarchaeaceae archaeon]